ncbi:MAG: YopX family protein [Oscillospiraceae bacterium]|nr:YopX family protein [Oscillospiraceae bacterium]
MREILFRGKRVENGAWVFGDLTHAAEYTIIVDRETDHMRSVDPDTVGQYTGLKDRNGTLIFEGDILKGKGKWRYIVKYCDTAAYFHAASADGAGWIPCMSEGTMKNYEVVGNVWESGE